MANPHLATTLDAFEATVHRTKNRLVAIPTECQQRLGLSRRPQRTTASMAVRAWTTSSMAKTMPEPATFIDTGYRVALLNRKDALHARALALAQQ